jgi:hypothetical protein
MTEAEKIIYTAIAALIIWIAQKVITYFVIRSRITQSLLSDIKLNIDQIKEAHYYLIKFESNYLVIGKKLGYVDRFTKAETSFYKSQIDDLPKYYSRKTLDKISKFYYSFWELQILIEGFTIYLNYLSEKDIELSKNEIERAKRKLSRIYKLIEVILKNKINTLSDLIENYEGRIGPDSMI